MRNKIVAISMALLSLLVVAPIAYASETVGWHDIRAALIDGDGSEFVVHTTYPIPISGSTEWEKVVYATHWVYDNIEYTADVTETWRASDQEYKQIDTNWDGDVDATGAGDCEEYAILLCALLRFNVGVPDNKVWVAASGVHAVVQYVSPSGFKWQLDPTNNWIRPGAAAGKIKFNDVWAVYNGPPY